MKPLPGILKTGYINYHAQSVLLYYEERYCVVYVEL